MAVLMVGKIQSLVEPNFFVTPKPYISEKKEILGSMNIPSKKAEFRTVIEIFKIRAVKIL